MKKSISYAIKDEKSAVPMYRKIKKSLKNKKDKHKIDIIIKDEIKHKKLLKSIKQ